MKEERNKNKKIGGCRKKERESGRGRRKTQTGRKRENVIERKKEGEERKEAWKRQHLNEKMNEKKNI